MELDCGSGCEVFIWPEARPRITNDPRFDEGYWPEGTEMCYPIFGESTEGTKEGTQNFTLGPAYQKPFPTQWCHGEHCREGDNDPLYTWGVSVDVINGVILGKADHHCEEDQCYYIQKSIYDEQLCDEDKFETHGFNWWWTFIVAEILQFSVMFLMNLAIRLSGNDGCWVFIACPICCLLCPSILLILGAAIFSPIFAKFLFVPFFVGLLTEWVEAAVVPPILTLPILLSHRTQFKKMFPGARNIEEFKKNKELDVGIGPKEMENQISLFEKIGEWLLFLWDMVTMFGVRE